MGANLRAVCSRARAVCVVAGLVGPRSHSSFGIACKITSQQTILM